MTSLWCGASVLGGSPERGAPEDAKSVGTQVEELGTKGQELGRTKRGRKPQGTYAVGGNRRIRREDLVYSAVSILGNGVEPAAAAARLQG